MKIYLIFILLFFTLSSQAQNYEVLIREGMEAIVHENYLLAKAKFQKGKKLAKKSKNKDKKIVFEEYLTKVKKYIEFNNSKHSIDALNNGGLLKEARDAKYKAYKALEVAASIKHSITDEFDQQQLADFKTFAEKQDNRRQQSVDDLLREGQQSLAAGQYQLAVDQFTAARKGFSGSESEFDKIVGLLQEARVGLSLKEGNVAFSNGAYEEALSIFKAASKTGDSPLIDQKIRETLDALCNNFLSDLDQLIQLEATEIKRLQSEFPKYGCTDDKVAALVDAEWYLYYVQLAEPLESKSPKKALEQYKKAKEIYASAFVLNKIKSLEQQINPSVAKDNSSPEKGMEGWVDMHAHPMSHLAFGGKLLHGAPDVGIIMPVIPNDCNRKYVPALSIEEALGNCDNTHGGNDLFRAMSGNNCGDDKRKAMLSMVEGGMGAAQKHGGDGARGYPDFNHWPAYNNLTHQQMYVDWIKRNYDNGLRVMVGLSVNNATYAAAFSGPGDRNPDDQASSDLQIQELKKMVGQHSWMEVAYSAGDLERIIKSGKLAVVLGVEVDNIGNFNKDITINAFNPSDNSKIKVKSEIKRLYDQGIRYIFPVHVVDNKFSGTAIYEPIFSVSNLHQTGEYWDVTCAGPRDDIGFKYDGGFKAQEAGSRAILGLPLAKSPSTPPGCTHGHINNRALTPLGKYALKEMMKKGMMIDVDHMSQKAVNESIAIATRFQYPLNSGHNGFRNYSSNANKPSNERNFTESQFKKIYDLGGMAGIGMAGLDAKKFEQQANLYLASLGKNVAIGLGTDANGMEPLPSPRVGSNVKYSPDFPQSKLGNQIWDYNKSGVAHYGLFADFLKDVSSFNPSLVNVNLNNGASYFAQMWEKCETQSRAIGD